MPVKGGEDDAYALDPGPVQHHCTDVLWLLVLFAGLAGLGAVEVYSRKHGNPARLTHGFNYQKQQCGVGNMTDFKFVYWCRGPDGKLDVQHPNCIESCPTGNVSYMACYDEYTGQVTQVLSYATKKRGPFCFPENSTLLRKFVKQSLGQQTELVTEIGSSLKAAKMLLAGSAMLAVVLGYGYLPLLRLCAATLARLSLFFMIMGPLSAAGFFLWRATTGNSLDQQWDAIFGVSALAVGVLFICVASCFLSGMDAAVGCVEAACECLFSEPSLLLEPFVSLALKGVTVALMVVLGVHLASTGEIEMSGLSGMSRSFSYSARQWGMFAFLVFMLLWLLELTNATSQYALAYATQLWYFTPYQSGRKHRLPLCGICRGYGSALLWHTGTLSFGALLMALMRFLRIILGLLAHASQSSGNCVGACIAKVCACIVSMFKACLQYLNSLAYMDQAISSDGYCHAVARATVLMAENGSAVAILHGAQVLFVLIGMGLICSIPAVATFLACTRLETFSDEGSEHYVARPKWVALAALCISAVVATSFMLVFDTVADSILYCFAVDESRQRRSLAALPAIRDDASESVESEEEEGFFGWLFGGGEEKSTQSRPLYSGKEQRPAAGSARQVFAPPRLQQLIEEHAS